MKNFAFAMFLMFISGSAFAVEVTDAATAYYHVGASDTDHTVINAKTPANDALGLIVFLPASPADGAIYYVADRTGNVDEDNYLWTATCVEVEGQAKYIDGSSYEMCMVVGNEGAYLQYSAADNQYHDILDTF